MTNDLNFHLLVMPKLRYADFHQNFPAGKVADALRKSRTQTVTNHEIMTKSWWKSPTQIMEVADTNHLDMSRCLWH